MYYKLIGDRECLFSFQAELAAVTYTGLMEGNRPTMTTEGTGGTYYMKNKNGEIVAVFKPKDEEPASKSGSGIKKGTKPGYGAYYEVAAYALDHPMGDRRLGSKKVVEKGFSGVPITIMVTCNSSVLKKIDKRDEIGASKHKESPEKEVHKITVVDAIGSLQMFMESDDSCADIGTNKIKTTPDQEVHKITVLDIRMANADRHGGNILYKQNKNGHITELIPIDHGCCLPDTFEDCTFVWLDWPQAKEQYSQDTIDYISSLDAEEDIKLLKHYGWDIPVESQRTLRISTKLLQKGVDNRLTPYEIGSFMCRMSNWEEESKLEKIITEAQPLFDSKDESIFLKSVYDGIDDLIHKHITANKTPK